MAAVDVVNRYLATLPGETRRVAHAEWGVSVAADAADGWPLHVGLRIADGLLTAKAEALHDAGGIDPWLLLWWNRQTRQVRFACSRSREVWVHADLPARAVDERSLDRLLGLVAEAALAVRDLARRMREPQAAPVASPLPSDPAPGSASG